MKTVGVVVAVFVGWCIVAFIVLNQQHIGQTYDPAFGGIGAWFVDPSKASEEAAWVGNAAILGTVVALGAGVIRHLRNRKAGGLR